MTYKRHIVYDHIMPRKILDKLCERKVFWKTKLELIRGMYRKLFANETERLKATGHRIKINKIIRRTKNEFR